MPERGAGEEGRAVVRYREVAGSEREWRGGEGGSKIS